MEGSWVSGQRLCDLAQWIWEGSRISVSEEALGREVRAMWYRRLSARPRHHAQHPDAAEALKKLHRRCGRNRRRPRQGQSDGNVVPG
uniref:Winged helix-turn-helix domain-containing protein n=1 Tax=Agrobacterium albertimagni TaxID=147266 RepID=A0A7C1T8B3_9HYPH